MFNKIIFFAFIAYTLILSLISFGLFKKDKKMAQSGGGPVRIKEKTLLASVAFGGALGGFIGRIVCHHKTEKKYFSFTIYLSLLLEVATLVVLGYLAFFI
ncbi:MAG: DUF1294 domain-containing protein [Gammaproteobacteria bacterium]|nr:DUF1294 domain-containing protein [Gammaproteobacteria bacterium]